MMNVVTFLLLFLFCALLTIWNATFVVPEGFVGIRYRFAHLENFTYLPGFYLSVPFSHMALVNVRPQTDQIFDVTCGTSDGLSLNFSTIDVGNTLLPEHVVATIRNYGEKYDEYLVKDKIRHQIQVICATMTFHEVFNVRFHEIDDLLLQFLTETNFNLTSKLEIDFVRLAKPLIPGVIATSFVQLAEESTMFKVEIEKQHRLEKEAETRDKILQAELNMQLKKSQQENHIQVLNMEAKEECEKIENRMREERAKTDSNAQKLNADALQKLYAIPRYPEYLIAQQFANAVKENSKFFFGTMPNVVPSSFFANISNPS